MWVASKIQGGLSYPGPCHMFMSQQHVHTFYIIELSCNNYYQAQSLTHHPNYSIMQSEITKFKYLPDSLLSQWVLMSCLIQVLFVSPFSVGGFCGHFFVSNI